MHDKQKHFIICLKEKTCSCNTFQLDEIPYAHACAVLASKNFTKGPYYCDLYKPKTVLITYDVPIYPLPHQDDWIISVSILGEIVLSPKYKRPLKRPANKNRRKSGRDMFGKKNINSLGLRVTIGIRVGNIVNDTFVLPHFFLIIFFCTFYNNELIFVF